MRKLTRIALALLCFGLVLWAGYAVQGSFIDEGGILQEPFHLLALGWLFVLTGGVALVGAVVVRIIKKWRNPK